MTEYTIRTVHSTMGKFDAYDFDQTPDSIAEQVEQHLLNPDFLDGEGWFALSVQPAPPDAGLRPPDQYPPPTRYLLAAGRAHEMALELYLARPGGSGGAYVVAGERVRGPDERVALKWRMGPHAINLVHVHPQEVFTGEQAVPFFRDFIIEDRAPDFSLLRCIRGRRMPRPARPHCR